MSACGAPASFPPSLGEPVDILRSFRMTYKLLHLFCMCAFAPWCLGPWCSPVPKNITPIVALDLVRVYVFSPCLGRQTLLILCITPAVCGAICFSFQVTLKHLLEPHFLMLWHRCACCCPQLFGRGTILWITCHSHALPTLVSSQVRCPVLFQVAFSSISWLCLRVPFSTKHQKG